MAFIFQVAGKARTADQSRIETLTALQPSRISTAKPPGARRIAAFRVAWPPNIRIRPWETLTSARENWPSTDWTGGRQQHAESDQQAAGEDEGKAEGGGYWSTYSDSRGRDSASIPRKRPTGDIARACV